MDDQHWNRILGNLDQRQLLLVRQTVDQLLGQRSYRNESEVRDQVSLDLERATLYSNDSTLYQSGRSTPIACAASSEKRANFSPSIYNGAAVRACSSEVPSWPSSTTSDLQYHPPSSLRQVTLQKATKNRRGGIPESKKFFCTFCAEFGKHTAITRKEDWKRHEEDYHEGAGIQWVCHVKDCPETFPRGLEFRRHLKKDHEGMKFPRDSKDIRRQLDRIYACGFENCRELNTNWKDHCDHVATHMQKGHIVWTYDRTIRTLLKHPDIATHWKNVYTTLCPEFQIMHSNLRWDIETTSTMREQLEFHKFQEPLEYFLRRLFLMGIPSTNHNEVSILPSLSTDLSSSMAYTAMPALPAIAPTLHSLMENSELGPSATATNISLDATNTDLVAPLHGYQNSVCMTDAPPFSNADPLKAFSDDPFGEIPTLADELLSLPDFMSEITSEFDHHLTDTNATVSDNGKSHSPRAIVAKSKEWFAAKRSQHAQHIVIAHPDVPAQHIVIAHPDVPAHVRLPASSTRKKSSATLRRMHHNQS